MKFEGFKGVLVKWLGHMSSVRLQHSHRNIVLVYIIHKWQVVDMGSVAIHYEDTLLLFKA